MGGIWHGLLQDGQALSGSARKIPAGSGPASQLASSLGRMV
jgi:hypothetical protein